LGEDVEREGATKAEFIKVDGELAKSMECVDGGKL